MSSTSDDFLQDLVKARDAGDFAVGWQPKSKPSQSCMMGYAKVDSYLDAGEELLAAHRTSDIRASLKSQKRWKLWAEETRSRAVVSTAAPESSSTGGNKRSSAVVTTAAHVTDTSQPAVTKKPKKKSRRSQRGGASNKEHQKKRAAIFIEGVRKARVEDVRDRDPGTLMHFGGRRVLPYFARGQEDHPNPHRDVSDAVQAFYRARPKGVSSVEVSEQPNQSNPEGEPGCGYGVFAVQPISKDTLLFPYVAVARSRPCKKSVACAYCLRVDEELVLCAREVIYDIAYLEAYDGLRGQEFRTRKANCPYNYARYMNTQKGGKDSDFNVRFQPIDDGLDCMWVYANRDIEVGEELLVDYGRQYTAL